MTLLLADVSEFQNVNWAAYGAANPAVIVRAHNGYRADYKWPQHRDGSRANCAWRGFYQYLPAGLDPRAAARDFAATVGPMLPGEVAILDLEEGLGDQTARRAAWLDELHAATEWTYSGLAFARAHLPGVRLDWIAAYQASEPTDAHLLWQYSDAQTFAGIGACDGSRFAGSLADLQALTGADMALTPEDGKVAASAVWGADTIPVKWGTPDPTNPTWGASTFFGFLGQWVYQTRDSVQAIASTLSSVKAALTAAAVDAHAGRVAAEAALAQAKANAATIGALSQTVAQMQQADAANITAAVTAGLDARIAGATVLLATKDDQPTPPTGA